MSAVCLQKKKAQRVKTALKTSETKASSSQSSMPHSPSPLRPEAAVTYHQSSGTSCVPVLRPLLLEEEGEDPPGPAWWVAVPPLGVVAPGACDPHSAGWARTSWRSPPLDSGHCPAWGLSHDCPAPLGLSKIEQFAFPSAFSLFITHSINYDCMKQWKSFLSSCKRQQFSEAKPLMTEGKQSDKNFNPEHSVKPCMPNKHTTTHFTMAFHTPTKPVESKDVWVRLSPALQHSLPIFNCWYCSWSQWTIPVSVTSSINCPACLPLDRERDRGRLQERDRRISFSLRSLSLGLRDLPLRSGEPR